MSPQRENSNPVVTGLVALLAVSLAVGLVLGGAALAATKFLGVGETDTAAADSTTRETLYLPKPQKTTASGPQITLNTEDPAASKGDKGEKKKNKKSKKDKSKPPEKTITLQAGQTSVENFGQIDLTGVYPGGEGAVLQVQRFEGGRWADFDATVSVSNETFATYVLTGVSGVNRFRVKDTSTGKTSNEVRVTVEP